MITLDYLNKLKPSALIEQAAKDFKQILKTSGYHADSKYNHVYDKENDITHINLASSVLACHSGILQKQSFCYDGISDSDYLPNFNGYLDLVRLVIKGNTTIFVPEFNKYVNWCNMLTLINDPLAIIGKPFERYAFYDINKKIYGDIDLCRDYENNIEALAYIDELDKEIIPSMKAAEKKYDKTIKRMYDCIG